jgi:hypothetical protein
MIGLVSFRIDFRPEDFGSLTVLVDDHRGSSSLSSCKYSALESHHSNSVTVMLKRQSPPPTQAAGGGNDRRWMCYTWLECLPV